MRSLLMLAVLLFSIAMIPAPADAGGYHHVRGYYRSNGTYVQPHYQTNPDSSRANNWSTRGNVNPFTGEPGTKSEDSAVWTSRSEPRPAPARHRIGGRSRWHLSNTTVPVCRASGRFLQRAAWPFRSHRVAAGVQRDSHGRIARSSASRMRFLRSQGLTHTPSGCQVDHVVPLARGGSDTPGNMQLLCGEALSVKERTELK